ncbi:peptidase inhibitor family I36 protein [[Kitasatospora] papulosa]|uniref:peptidase inhibitor family I36 protein n=1 Tax=[Kitasatospora] papulosa TaxID=1464011 RepID=UPI00367EE634
MPYHRTAILAAAAIAASLALTACGTEEPEKSADSAPKKLSGEQRTITEQAITIPQLQDKPQLQGGFGVVVCEDVDFVTEFCDDVPSHMEDAPKRFNDNTSSIKNQTPFSVTFYENNNFSGTSITLKPREEVSNLGAFGAAKGVDIDKKISSWQPQVETRAGERAVLTVCTDNDLAGQCEDVPVAEGAAKLNDSISSIQNTSDFDITFYADKGWRGAGITIPSRTYLRTIDPVGINGGLNDAISSWQPVLSN